MDGWEDGENMIRNFRHIMTVYITSVLKIEKHVCNEWLEICNSIVCWILHIAFTVCLEAQSEIERVFMLNMCNEFVK